MRLSYRIISVFLISILILLPQGCAKKRLETEKKILDHDSSFQDVLDKRNSLIEEMDTQKITYLGERQAIDGKIRVLRSEKTQLKRDHVASIEKVKHQILPDKRALQEELMDMQRRYNRKRDEFKDVSRDVEEISALVKKKDKLVLTQDEIRAWNDRLTSLEDTKTEVQSDMQKLKEDVEITRLKIKVLEL